MKIRNSPTYHGPGGYSGLRARNLTFKKVVKQVMRDQSNNQFMIRMENMIRRIVQEETNRILQPFLSSSWVSMERSRSETPSSRSETPSSRPRFKLRFINSPPSSIFTGSKIEAENGSHLMIELVDAATNTRVVSGPLSSSRIELVPLDGDFTEESWTVEEFKRNILKQREGKRPLLTGGLTVTLKDGVGVIAGDLAFSDNSSWTRSGKFRLGARLTGDGATEARSLAFGCRDQRGESYRKHHPPYSYDDVWRLEKIAKDGVMAKRLAKREIYTVKDFRRWYTVDPIELYNIGGVPKKTWKAIVSHAMNCVLDETDCYIYNANAPGVSLLFNSFYELKKVSFNSGGDYQNVDQLTNCQSILNDLKHEAYQNLNRFTVVNSMTFVGHPQRSLQCPQDPGFGITYSGSQHIDFQGTMDPSSSSMSVCHTGASSSTVHPPDMQTSFENSSTATFHFDKKFLPSFRNSFKVSELEPIHVTRGCIEKDEENENDFSYHNHYDMTSNNWSPGTHQAIDTMYLTVSGTEEAGMIDVHFANINMGSPRARWCKVKAAFKLREVWRNTTARNRRKACKKPCQLPY